MKSRDVVEIVLGSTGEHWALARRLYKRAIHMALGAMPRLTDSTTPGHMS